MKYLTLVLLAAGLSGTALAEDFDYNFASATYGRVDFDDLNVDGDGFGLGVSLGIADNFHLFADYQGSDLDFGLDATEWGAGIAYNTPVSEVIDVIAKLSYEYIELDAVGPVSFDDNGFGLGVGIRAAVSDKVEINAGIEYVDFGDGGDNTVFIGGALFNVTENISVGLSGQWDDDVARYNLGGRFYFGK